MKLVNVAILVGIFASSSMLMLKLLESSPINQLDVAAIVVALTALVLARSK